MDIIDKLTNKIITEALYLKIQPDIVDGVNYKELVHGFNRLQNHMSRIMKHYQPNFLSLWSKNCKLDIQQLSECQDLTHHLDHNSVSDYPLSIILFDYNRNLDDIIYILRSMAYYK